MLSSLLALLAVNSVLGDDGDEDKLLNEMISNDDLAESEEGKLLNELINEELAKSGVEHPFRFGGSFNFTAIFSKQDENEDKDDAFAVEEGFVSFDCLKKYDGYGYGFETMAKISSHMMIGDGPIFRTACLFLESDNIGIFKVGYTRTAADTFSVDSCGILVGYNGFESQNFSIFYNVSAGSTVDIGSQWLDDSRAAKIYWKSPVVSGFSMGLSFTPDSRDITIFKTSHKNVKDRKEGDDKLISQFYGGLGKPYSKNIITAGAAYEFGDPKALNAKISVAGWFGKGQSGLGDVKVHNVRAYNIDAKICYGDFKIAFAYTDNGKSLLAKETATADIISFDPKREYKHSDPEVGFKPGADAGKLYSVRAAYSFGKLAFSAGYLKSVVKFSGNEKSKADMISIGTEYTVNKTLQLYFEYDNIATDTCARAQAISSAGKGEAGATGKNKANMFLFGSKINI
jgi:predicted porin